MIRFHDFRRWAIAASIAGWLACAPSRAVAQDWPQWRGAGRDGRVAGFQAPAVWPETLARVWSQPVGLGDATPALVGGRLYVFGRQEDQEVMTCLAAADGHLVWREAYPAAPVTGPAEKYAGPRSSPAVADDRVVFLGVGGVVTCLEAATGARQWRHEALTKPVPRFFTSMSPLVTGGLCVVHLGGKEEGLLVALELATGRVKWQWSGEGPAYSSPVLVTVGGVPQILLQTEKTLSGFALTNGRRLWQVVTSPKSGYWNSVTPVVDGAVVYYSGQGTGTRALRLEAGDGGWTAQELWHNEDVGTVYNTPVLRAGALFGLSPRGQFFCLEAATGATKWLHAERVSNFGAIVDAGSVLVALPEKSGVIAYQASTEGYREVARYKVSDTPVYAHPVLAGKRIYVRERDAVTAWQLPEG